jgi:hypothetical protein
MRSEATVVDLGRRRIERLADELEPFLRRGHAVVEVDRVPSADEWRAAARLAARRNGWQVRTGMSRGRERAFAARVDPAFEERWNRST